MEILGCGHAGVAAPARFCPHLLGAKEVDYAHCLRGVGLEFDAACADCGARFGRGEAIDWGEVCAACSERIMGDWDEGVWIGEAQILEDPAPFDATLFERALPLIEGAVFSVAPDASVWAFANGELWTVGEEASVWMRLELPPEPEPDWGERIRLTPRLEISPTGRFALLVRDFGRFGTVADLQTRAVTMRLDRGDYHPEQTPFPAAFFGLEGRELLVHGTDWNRLDISDPQTGELISIRESPRYEEQVRPAHYLDYFHGGLHVSPQGEWVLDDGWVWAPVGVPAWWSLKRWLSENPWESEDGPSLIRPTQAANWNEAMCWVGDERIALAGLEGYDGQDIKAARIFNLKGNEILAFAGPRGEFWSDGARLFSADESGLQIWDVASGARTGTIAGFKPGFQIEGALIEISGQTLRLWNHGAAL